MVEALRGVSTIDLLKPNIESTFSPGRLFRVPVTTTSSISGSCAEAVRGSPVKEKRSAISAQPALDKALTVDVSLALTEGIFCMVALVKLSLAITYSSGMRESIHQLLENTCIKRATLRNL